MKRRRTLGIVLSVTLGIGLLWAFLAAQPTVATTAPTTTTDSTTTTSITITKYAADGTTIVGQETLTHTKMEATLPVQGDGKTHYYFQGPTFDPGNLWDPEETVNLKNKGAIKGTDVKDLVELVGGAETGDQIEIKAIDGYGDIFQHDDVYNPEAGQGKMVIAWYTKGAGDPADPLYPDGAYVPDFEDGMQLIFLVETTNAADQHVFGHDDMRSYLPQDNWHYFYAGGIQYPSSNGISIKYISEINVYTEAPEPWSIDITGAVTTPVSQSWFENALACHEEVEWTDAEDNVYSGLPLWWLLGLADDDYVHGLGSFNDALAEAGYDIEVKAGDDYTRTFRSEDVRRSSGYIVANEINGNPLTDTYPLRLVGSALTSGRDRVGQIESINLLNIPDIDTWTLELSGAYTHTMRQSEFDSAVLCPDIGHRAVYTDGEDVWEGLPLWLLVGWVDDDDAHGPDAFNDELAGLGYQVRVVATDGFSHTFDIADVARNDDIIVASTLNADPLPEGDYPLRLVGSDLTSGKQRVGQIARIELLNLPAKHYVYMPLVNKNYAGWELGLSGAMTTTLTPSDFQAEAAEYPASWEHPDSGDTYSGVPLWWLVGLVDDENPDAFNDDLADLGYQVKVIALDGYFYTFGISDVARNDNIIVASAMNDEPLPDDEYPLRLVGDALISGGQRVKQIARIELLSLPTLPPDWQLELSGALTDTLTATDFQAEAASNPVSWDDGSGSTYSGVALWRLVGMVDDEDPTTFNDALAAANYSVNVLASDNYSRSVDSTLIARNDDIIVADQLNGQPLPNDEYPLRLVGTSLSSGQMVSMIVKIALLDMPTVEGY
jgi:DMSO/TMAO reductase YedYZ molybdopterin-dependent catalytic subunit